MSGVVSYELFSSKLPSEEIGFTSIGGLYQTFVNDTGSDSVLGTIVVASTSVDGGVSVAPAGSQMAIGIVAENGVNDGDPVKVVTSGKAYVLLRDSLSSNNGYWCGVSVTAGRIVSVKFSANITGRYYRTNWSQFANNF